MTLIEPKLLAAARVLSGLSQAELAGEAGVHRNAVQRIESGADLRTSTLKALLDVLERHGVEFVAKSPTHVGGVMLKAEPGRSPEGG